MKTILAVLLVAVAYGGVFLFAHGRQLRQEYQDAVQRSRWQRAANLSDQLAMIGQAEPDASRSVIENQIIELQKRTEREAPTPQSQYSQAIAFSQLDRFADAERVLRPIVDQQAGAKLMLATVLQAQSQYDESDRVFKECQSDAKQWRTMPALMPRYLSALGGPMLGWSAREELAERRNRASDDYQRCVDGLAYNARQKKQHSLATRIYREAMTEHPSSSAHYQFQLGLTCVESDSLAEAIQAFEEAARLNPPSFRLGAEYHISRLKWRANGCQFTTSAKAD